MKKILGALLLTMAFAAPASAVDFGGKYKVEGTNINGTKYGGEATITVTSETTCEIKWVTGDTTSEGICMRNDDSFAAGYMMGTWNQRADHAAGVDTLCRAVTVTI